MQIKKLTEGSIKTNIKLKFNLDIKNTLPPPPIKKVK